MWELDYKESWAQKNWCFWTVVLEKTLESPLECKQIQPVHPKGDQSWVFIGGTNVEAETPILWPPHVKSWLTGKDSDAGRDWGQEEKGTTEDEMVGWHHQLNGHGFGWTPGVGDGQGSLVCCGSWGRSTGHDWATELNWIMNVRVRSADTPCSRKSNFNFVASPPELNSNQLQIVYYCIMYLWKELACKWTHAVQTCIFQGSSVLKIPTKSQLKDCWI